MTTTEVRSEQIGDAVLPAAPATPGAPADLPVIGYVSISPGEPCQIASSFRAGLQQHGYADGENVRVEWRFAAGHPDRYPALIDDLVRRRIDLLVMAESQAIPVAMAATDTIPIVMLASGDPVGLGFTDSLERPNRNVTGMTNLAVPLARQRLAVLQAVLPAARRCAVLWNDRHSGVRHAWEATRVAAAALAIEVCSYPIRAPGELRDAIAAAACDAADTLLVLQDHLTTSNRREITAQALAVGLPGMYG